MMEDASDRVHVGKEAWFMVMELLEIDLEGTPSCQSWPCPKNHPERDARECGKPSVARVRVTCPCGTRYSFICGSCLDDLARGATGCATCLIPITDWVLA